MDLDIFNPTRQLRRAVLFWLSILLGFISSIFLISNFINDTLTSCHVFAAGFILLSGYVAYFCFRQRMIPLIANAYCYGLIASVSAATYTYPISYGIFIWTCFFPVIFYLVLGKRYGFIATSAGFILQLLTIGYQVNHNDVANNLHLTINLAFAFICIWFTCHILEVKRRTSEASLGQLASRDALTGVYNRHALVHNFSRYRNESERVPLSLLILDLDYFKAVNDKYGHDTGDTVLVQAAALIDSLSNEHLVYRIGGEEFCIALHNTNAHQAQQQAENIRHAIENYTFNSRNEPISLTTSIGVYQCDHYADLESVLRSADKELYRAKRNGRNQVMVCDAPAV